MTAELVETGLLSNRDSIALHWRRAVLSEGKQMKVSDDEPCV